MTLTCDHSCLEHASVDQNEEWLLYPAKQSSFLRGTTT